MAEISIKRIGRSFAEIRIEGTAPLIMNKFSSKARQQMADKQQGRANIREAKNPEELFLASLHVLPSAGAGDDRDSQHTPGESRYGMPAVAFKGAMVDAARYFKGSKLTMTALKSAIFVKGEGPDMLVPIEGTPKMREDPVRNATGVADIRYRGEFWPWSAALPVVFIRGMFDVGSLIALVDAAGIGGIGEWRPNSKESKTGMYGTFTVPDQEVKVIEL